MGLIRAAVSPLREKAQVKSAVSTGIRIVITSLSCLGVIFLLLELKLHFKALNCNLTFTTWPDSLKTRVGACV